MKFFFINQLIFHSFRKQMTEPTQPPPIVNPFQARLMALVMSKTTAYTALVEAVEPLRKFISNESDCYKAAFDVVGKTRTVDQILQAIDFQHTPALEEQLSNFKAQAQHQDEQGVSAQQREVTELQQQLALDNEKIAQIRLEADKQIAILTEGVEAKKKTVTKLQGAIAEKQASLNLLSAQFNEAVLSVREHLAQCKEKVVKYLKAA
jgi:hypothetical protein